jgi:hypothetical protein
MASSDSLYSSVFGLDSMHHSVMIPYAHKVSNSIPQQVADSKHAFRRDQGGKARQKAHSAYPHQEKPQSNEGFCFFFSQMATSFL